MSSPITKVDRAGIQKAFEIMLDTLDKLGFNTPSEEARGNTAISVAVRNLGSDFDLKVLNMYFMSLMGELQVELNSTRDPKAAKAIEVVKGAIDDVRGCLRG